MTTDFRPAGSPLLPVAALVAGMVSLQSGAALAKTLFPVVGASGVSALRVGFSALILLAVWRPWRRSLPMRDAGWILLYGVALGLMNLLFYRALLTIPLGPAVAIEFAGPLTVALSASRRLFDVAWIGLAVLGLGLLLPLGGAGALDPVGVAYALGAALAWALYILFGQRAGRAHGGQAVSLGMLTAALVIAPFGLAEAGTALFEPATLASGLVVAVMSSALPYSLEMVALRRLDRQVFGVMMSVEPAIASLAAMAILGERLGPVQWFAIACVIVASVGITARSRPRPAPGAP
ncbi:membrane protein [Methylobacterium gregans]|uniref:Threonine/homoserine exporter RhtA n=2 Tax=Methylobacterium gregans TaxID=374424 RepID=A0AA37HR36_9HYPH|nr:inner membrane transporter RhtA [Methylobacterium gregans]GJD80464.1 Threonine/homoserine exporter RhtA [Methylobacterium gregans]GLS52576.1 membrane protein [Methylobacterium gregans]